ncbi:ABC transporter ATP-binding protein/permease [Bacillus timonensis]|nr:ABC transporter ATP-binding protein/permease [Bacillus timonensis]
MSKMFQFLKPYRLPVSVALFLMLVELFVELFHPLIMAKIIDEGILKEDLTVVIIWGSMMVIMSLLAFLSGITNSFFASHVSQSFGFDVREKLYEKIQSFSFANSNKFPTSSLITRMTNDVTQVQNTVFMSLRIMLRAPLLIIGGTIMAVVVNAKLALVLLIAVPLLLLFLVYVMNKGWSLFNAVQQKLDNVNGVMRENLGAIRLIKALLRAKHEVNRFTDANEQLKQKTVAALRLMEITMPILLLLMNVSILVILWFGSIGVENNQVKVGEVVAIINYSTRITAALSIFSFIVIAFSKAKASASRISEVLETEVDLVDTTEMNNSFQIKDGKIEFQKVSFTYPDTKTNILENLTFTVSPNQTIAILGSTGSGKTSLFQLIPRLYDVNEGTILIDQQDIRDIQLEKLRRNIGLVPQEAWLFTGTIRDNIAWGKEDATLEEVIKAAKDAQIHETIVQLPKQYETLIGQKGVNLSGGQKQRLSIARALVRKPKILLLDDSTSALDVNTEAKLLNALKEYTCTTLIITQKISTAIAADAIYLLDEGKIVEKGSHEELLSMSTLYQKIYESQYGKEKVNHA